MLSFFWCVVGETVQDIRQDRDMQNKFFFVSYVTVVQSSKWEIVCVFVCEFCRFNMTTSRKRRRSHIPETIHVNEIIRLNHRS